MNNLRFREFYRRRLPHIQIAGATYFVTFRLKGSLPMAALEKLSQQSKRIKRLPQEKIDHEKHRWFEMLDNYLDQGLCGETFLKNEHTASLVAEAIYYRDTKVYD